jgi:hypothetical protein
MKYLIHIKTVGADHQELCDLVQSNFEDEMTRTNYKK